MNKSQIIDTLARESGISQEVSEYVVNEFFRIMTEALVRGEGIEIRGFGSFSVREYEPYIGRNPRTGEKVMVGPKKLPFFKVGKDLRDRVMNSSPPTQ
ncbi:MAG: integration host factor subunit beta [Deltaproteobacteria bacterium]